MGATHLHIVTHDVPWPADFGGVVDLFYKLKYLHQAGVQIHLHCFTHSRPPQPELDKYCVEVHYYERNRNIKGIGSIPFIVKSRTNKALLERLQQDDYPILLEGIHCTYYLFTGDLAGRKIIVRLHNVEFEYYRHLALHEHNLLKKLYYIRESRLLRKYEAAIANKALFVCVSKQDAQLYKEKLGAESVEFLPVFTPFNLVTGKEGAGTYCLYHGNLAINENEQAATWLLQKVSSNTSIPLVIAGRKPSAKLERLAHQQQHTCIVANPTDAELQDLLARAQVNVLPSFNNTGVKLKLLNALCNGRHCLVNEAAVSGSGLEAYCHTAGDAENFAAQLEKLYNTNFTAQMAEERQGLLQREYNNTDNLARLLTWIQ